MLLWLFKVVPTSLDVEMWWQIQGAYRTNNNPRAQNKFCLCWKHLIKVETGFQQNAHWQRMFWKDEIKPELFSKWHQQVHLRVRRVWSDPRPEQPPTGRFSSTCPHCQSIRFKNLLVSLKPREDLWTVVARKMRAIRPNNTEELKATIKATCTSRASQQGLSLMGSLRSYITAVTHAGGAQTKHPRAF